MYRSFTGPMLQKYLKQIYAIEVETVHPDEHRVIAPFWHKWDPNECSFTPIILNVSLFSCMTLWNIFMNRPYWLFPVKREQFPFRRSGCERRYFANARTGQSSGFFGFEYTCHGSPDLSPYWSPFFVKIKHQSIIIPLNMIYIYGKAAIYSREEVPL